MTLCLLLLTQKNSLAYVLEEIYPKVAYVLEEISLILAYVLESLSCFFYVWQYGQHIIPIEVKAGTNSHLRSLHSFINNSQNTNIAIRVWSGEYFVQETKTPAPFNKPFRLINLPFYLVGSIDNIVEEEIKK